MPLLTPKAEDPNPNAQTLRFPTRRGFSRKRESMAVEKSAEELRKEIQELQRQHREISDRLRDPRGIRRGGGATPGGPRQQQRGVVRPAPESDDQPAQKRRLLSTLVTPDGGEVKLEEKKSENPKRQPATQEATGNKRDPKSTNNRNNTDLRRDPNSRVRKNDFNMEPPEPTPRVFPKIEDPYLVKRNRRMLGQLLGTLEKFREEDQKLSNSEAIMRRNDSLKRAEEKAREESEKLKNQEKETIAEKRRRDMTLRARVAAKAEEKRLELLFLQWTEHQKKLSNFLRTKAHPPIYYMPAKPLTKDSTINEQRKEKVLSEWKATRRAELSEFQKKVEEQYLSKVEEELERRNKKAQNRGVMPGGDASLAETMDKELETHRLAHGPKKRRILDEDDDVDDEDDELAMDDERIEGADVAKVSEDENGNN
ncbi:hypothetical protein LUZ60_006324 [Juncus effusus]|nr:hypothetical protein LUZ60_006324 [Juncus effusus]